MTDPTPPRRMRIAALLAIAVLGATGCGGADDTAEGPAFRVADDVTLDVADELATTTTASAASTDDERGSADGDAVDTTSTIPLNDEDPGQSMLDALGVFNECLAELGTEFVGDPRTAEEGSPAADPDYLEDLSTCAARSNILEAFSSMQEANAALTPEEIEERNRGLEVWADCMRGRGWSVELVADDRGLLNPDLQDTDGLGPGGLLESDDMEECAAEAGATDDGTEG